MDGSLMVFDSVVIGVPFTRRTTSLKSSARRTGGQNLEPAAAPLKQSGWGYPHSQPVSRCVPGPLPM